MKKIVLKNKLRQILAKKPAGSAGRVEPPLTGSVSNAKDNITQTREKNVNNKSLNSASEVYPSDVTTGSSTPNSSLANSTPSSSLTTLQQKMKKKLQGAQFRWLNEKLYTSSSNDAVKLMKEKPQLFELYHEGFRSQVTSWPVNPVDIFIKYIKTKPKSIVIADLGCGDAKIAKVCSPIGYKINSFDLVSRNEFVVSCDIAQTPLKSDAVDICIFCLSLMGTNFMDFLKEGYRILKPNGELKIAEVVSRFSDVPAFLKAMQDMGFDLIKKDESNPVFVLMDFRKKGPITNSKRKREKGKQNSQSESPVKKSKKLKKFHEDGRKDHSKLKNSDSSIQKSDAEPLLKACVYKKR